MDKISVASGDYRCGCRHDGGRKQYAWKNFVLWTSRETRSGARRAKAALDISPLRHLWHISAYAEG